MTRTVLGTEVYEAYVRGVQDYGKNYSRETVFFEGDTIYSYGYHFPMAIRMQNDFGFPWHLGTWYLVNGDTYSVTTSKHQSDLRQALTGERMVIIPFSSLDSANIDVKSIELLDQEPDITWTETRKRKNWRTGEYETYEAHLHLLGASVFRARFHGQDDMHYFLSGLDKSGRDPWSSYFLAELPFAVDSVEKAYDALKPTEVIFAEADGLDVLRQGEWFFIPVTDKNRIDFLNKEDRQGIAERMALLPNARKDRTFRHKVTRLVRLNNGELYVRGTCRHTGGEHRMLKLNGWYRAVENTELGSWTSFGRVD